MPRDYEAKDAGALGGYDKPWKDNPQFILAMARCIEAHDNFKPLKEQKWAEIKNEKDLSE